MAGTDPLDRWRGDFGDAYIERNDASLAAVRTRVRALAPIAEHLRGDPPRSILEVGPNIGLNLRALPMLVDAELHAVEPNPRARERLLADGVLDPTHLHDGSAVDIPLGDGAVDMAFTSGVLIHVPPDQLGSACDEIHRVARRYVLALEYFSKQPETLHYRGHDDMLFKRDFGGFWLDRHPDLVPVAEGFCWQRTTGMDDATWWLFRKP